jgi:hypothetical protein
LWSDLISFWHVPPFRRAAGLVRKLGCSLATPDKIRSLQRRFYCKAKAEPAFRFYVLYDKICREDILRHAYGLARANAGAPGVDGVNFAQIEAQGLEAWLAGPIRCGGCCHAAKKFRDVAARRLLAPIGLNDRRQAPAARSSRSRSPLQ